MDLASLIEHLDGIIRDAKSMPLSSSALVNREDVLDVLEAMRQAFPEEIRQARWVVKDREELLEKARDEAQKIVKAARAEQQRLAQREEVVDRKSTRLNSSHT